MGKLYTVFNLSKGSLQLPNRGYLKPHPDADGYDRSYPVEIPEGHILWKMARANEVRGPMVGIAEGDVPWPTPEKAAEVEAPVSTEAVPEKAEDTTPPAPAAEETPVATPVPAVEVHSEVAEVVAEVHEDSQVDLTRVLAGLGEEAEDDVPELETETEEEPQAAEGAPDQALSNRQRKKLEKQKNQARK